MSYGRSNRDRSLFIMSDSAEVTAKLDAANADPDAIQRFRDGMVFIIAIQTFFLLLLPDSVGWVMVAERHAEAVFGENPTAAQPPARPCRCTFIPPTKANLDASLCQYIAVRSRQGLAQQGFGVFRLPDRLQPSRFPKLLWALLFLVVQFAEVIFKEGTFDEHGNPTDQGDWLGTDFGTGQRLQMTVTSTNAEGKLSDSSEIAELSTPWAARQWEDMKAKAGGMVDKLNRQVQMAANVASKYLSMLMPFIEEVAGGNIRGGTIIGNDFRHMRKVVTYGTANNFHYSTFPAYRTVEAQVVHMDVQPDPRNDHSR
ncbi:hypothetical protein V8C86DRAFT_2912112 [Haematococcus lacustris]